MKRWHVYLCECRDGSLYCGITTNLKRRIDQHNGVNRGRNLTDDGKGAKCLRGKRPVKLVWSEEAESRTQASKREAEIKRMTHEQKVALAGAKHEPTTVGVC